MKRMWSRVVPANSRIEDVVFTVLCMVLILLIVALISLIFYVAVTWPMVFWWLSNTIFGTTIPLTFKTLALTWFVLFSIQFIINRIVPWIIIRSLRTW
jgi:hypothetical protein